MTFATAIGVCGVRWSDAGITEVFLPGSRQLSGARPGGGEAPDSVRAAVADMIALLDGERRDLRHVAVAPSGLDAFHRRVFTATRAIAPGATASYGEIARAIGAPEAAREVGSALGANPVPIIVPCHRVVAADGALTGFSAPGGIATKRRLLEIEGAPGFTQQVLFS